jgi:hypothetical protein
MTRTPTAGIESRFSLTRSAILLAGLFTIEIAVFYWTVIWHVVPFYPINSDQTSYYLDTYAIIDKGWHAVVDEYINGAHATGVGFTAAGAVLGLLFGANRTVIITLNLICFLALQLVQFRVVYVRTRSLELAWLSIALLIACQTVFNGAGGIYDFRIDFSALCIYGIWVCSILWSDILRHNGRSLIVAATAILLVSFRYLTALYVAAILGALLIIFIWSMLKPRSPVDRDIARLRIRNWFIAGALIALAIVPLLFSSWPQIYNYYVVGHVLGEERYIRAHALGLFTLTDHILYYPISIYKEHLRWPSVALMAFIVLVSGAFVGSPFPRLVLTQRLKRYGLDLTVLAFAIIFPIVALTADIAKSSVVGGIIVVPIILFFTFLCAVIWQGRNPVPSARVADASTSNRLADRRFLYFRHAGVIAAGMIGLGFFATRGLTPPDGRPASDLRQVTEINEAIDRYLIQYSPLHPTISIDRVTDYLNLGTVILFGFERYHRLIELSPRFGHSIYGIFAVPHDIAMKLFTGSDIIVLTDPVRGRTGYPTDEKIVEYWDEVNAWTRQNRTLLYSANIFGVPYAVYVRYPKSASGGIK